MALTDMTIRQAKHGPKPIKLGDERGLFILLQPSGGKLWRLKYRFGGKEKKLSLGIYPDISLSEARRRDEARTLIATGTDPNEDRKQVVRERIQETRNRFGVVADEYLTKIAAEERAPTTSKNVAGYSIC